MVPEQLRGGRDFYFYQQRTENVPGHEQDGAKLAPLVSVPFVPIANLRRLKELVTLVASMPGLKESETLSNFEVTNAGKSVDAITYAPRGQAEDREDDAPDVKIFNAWRDFQEKFRECEQLQEDSLFTAAAVLMLRKMKLGHDAVRSLVRIVDHPLLAVDLRCSMLYLLRQIVLVEDDIFSDAALLQKDESPVEAENDTARADALLRMLTLSKSCEERQNIIAAWSGDFSLPPKIIELVSADSRQLLLATLGCASAILLDGNLKIQTTMLKWSQERSDEDFFIQTRVKLLHARDQLRDRKRAIKREIPEKAKRLERLPDDLHKRLDRRFNFAVPLRLLQVIQLMCEGHYTDMQNYMRDQHDNQISINVLESVTGLLEILAKCVDRTTYELTLQTLATMTELVQGPCFGNQEFFTSQNVGETIMKLLSTEFGDIDDDQLWRLRMSAVTLLQSLFEGHMNVHLVTTLIQSLSFRTMIDLMDKTYKDYMTERGEGGEGNLLTQGFDVGKDLAKGLLFGLGEEDEFQDKLNLACNIFIFLKATLDIQTLTIARDDDKENDSFLDRDGCTVKAALGSSKTYKKLSKKVATIEIARNGTIEKAYFRKPRVSMENLKEASKDNLIKDVEREGDTARLKDFFERSFNLIREMEYYEEMRKTPGLSIIYKYSNWFDTFALAIAFVMNIYLISVVDYENATDVGITPGGRYDAFEAIGITIIVLQCLLFVNFFFGPCRIHLNERWMAWQDQRNEQAQKESKEALSIQPAEVDNDAVSKLRFPQRALFSVFFIFTWYPFYQSALFIVTAFLGFYHTPVWYCVQLFQIVEKSAQLQNVILSVTKNGKNLILTGCLLLVIVYTFAIIAYYNYSQYIIPENFGHGGNCDTLARCVLMMLVNGLKYGGGVSEILDFPAWGKANGAEGYVRLIYDFMFFLVLIVIFLNIVFGIILDTFGELRENRDGVVEDQKGKCFICGIERADFDRVSSGGFEHHFTFEHHMWDYLFYMHYVKLKPSDEHNGSEGFVWECMEKLEPKFFPIAKAMVLEGVDSDEDSDSDSDGDDDKKSKRKAKVDAADEDGANAAFEGAGADRAQLEELQRRFANIEKMLAQLVAQ